MMASISLDSELMTNYVSAVPIPAGSHQVCVLDEKRTPMVFCLSNDTLPKLQALCRDEKGNSALIDLHAALELPDEAFIQAFHVEQSWSLKMFLCVAYKMDDTSSQLIVTKPFTAEAVKARISLAKIHGNQSLGTVQKMYMSPISGTNSDFKYPDIFLVHRALDQSKSWGSDITHIRIVNKLTEWVATPELSTPENASSILDITPAVSPYGQGLYVLYVTQGITKLFARFLRPDPNADDGAMFTFVTDVMCPKSARCISSVLDERGYSSLLIAAQDGVRFLNIGESTSKDKPGKLIFNADMFRGIRQLQVVQDKTDITMWFKTPRDELGYSRTKFKDLAGSAVSSLLLPAKSSSSFAPVVTRADPLTGDNVRQMLISNDQRGNLMLLEHTDDIGMWRKTPFFAPSKSTPTEITSYTVTLKAKEKANLPLDNGAVFLSASSTLSIIVNGRNMLLTQVPTWFDCDENGSLDFIIPTDSLGSQVFRVESLKNKEGEILDLELIHYDPATKPMSALAEKLKEVHDGGSLGNLKTSTGESLLDADVLADKSTLDGAHNCLNTITQAYMQLPNNGLSALEKDAATMATAAIKSAQRQSADVGDLLMDAWHWMSEQVEEITEWFIETAGSVWKFVCKLAGQVKEFVLDCVEKICEAATWIWQKLKVGWQKLVDFIGFLFNWDDILTTKDSISSMLTAGFGYASLKVDDFVVKIDGFFDNLESTINQFGESIKTDKQLTADSDGDNASKDGEVAKAQNGTSSTWASERLKNGGAGSDSKTDLKGATTSDEATDFWNDTMAPEMAKLDAQLSKIGSDITSAFKKDSVGVTDMMKISKSLLLAGVSAVRGVIKGLLGLLKGLIRKLSELGNAEIDIPIFSWLYKKITKGHALTLFDAISLIIAIPTTVFAKLITGKAPPTFVELDAPMLKGLMENDESIEAQTKTDFAIFKAEVAIGVTLTTGVVAVIKLLYKMATLGLDEVLEGLDEGPSSLFDIFGICSDMIGSVMAIPEESDLPGGDYRTWISVISFARGAYHTLAFFTPKKGKFEKIILGLDLLTVLANFGLSIAVGVAEHEAAKQWEEYDEDTTNSALVSAGLNAISGIAYFTAFFFKSTNPDISAGGAAVMVGTMAGTAVLEGIVFKLQYDDMKRTRLLAPPAF